LVSVYEKPGNLISFNCIKNIKYFILKCIRQMNFFY
jgi:hypothetical protein